MLNVNTVRRLFFLFLYGTETFSSSDFPFDRLAPNFLPAPSTIGRSTDILLRNRAVMLLPRVIVVKNLPEEFSFPFLHAVMLLCIGPSSKNLHRGGFIHSFIFNSFIVRGQGGTGRKELQKRDGKMFLLRVLVYSCAQSNLYYLLYLPPTSETTA